MTYRYARSRPSEYSEKSIEYRYAAIEAARAAESVKGWARAFICLRPFLWFSQSMGGIMVPCNRQTRIFTQEVTTCL